jgi:hypothetical protein
MEHDHYVDAIVTIAYLLSITPRFRKKETLFTQNIKVKNKNNQRRMNKNVDIKFSAYDAVLE